MAIPLPPQVKQIMAKQKIKIIFEKEEISSPPM
jgi:hypothetical protein